LKPYQELDPSFHFLRFATDSCHEEARQVGDLLILVASFFGTLKIIFLFRDRLPAIAAAATATATTAPKTTPGSAT
jgi:hypothetical protein